MDADQLAALEDERAFLLRSLDDLDREHDAGDLDDHDYAELRDGYTARAARVIGSIEAGQISGAGAVGGAEGQDLDAEPVNGNAPASSGGARLWRRASGMRVMTVAAIAVFAVVAGALVARYAGTRLPGQTGSGNSQSSLATKLAEARSLLGRDTAGAISRYDAALVIDPDNVEAITYRAWVQMPQAATSASPEVLDRVRSELDRAISVDPTYADAHVFRGVLAWRNDHDAATAVAQFDAYYALDNPPPQVASLVRSVDTEARAALNLPARFPAEASSTTTAPVAQGNDAALQLVLGKLCPGALDDPVSKLKDYSATLTASPDDPSALRCRGWVLFQAGVQLSVADSVTKGMASLDRAVEVAPADAGSQLLRGIAGLIHGEDPTATLRHFDAFFALTDVAPDLVELARPFDDDAHRAAAAPPRSGTSAAP